MPRGEKVGDAYVRITADGSGMDEGIRDGLKGADKDVEKAGERHGDSYNKGWERRLNRSRVGQTLARTVERAQNDPKLRKAADNIGKRISDWINGGQDDDWIDNTVKKMHELSDSTDRVGRRMGRNGSFLAGFRDHVDNLDDGLSRFAFTAGRLTGRGSRNDFLHFFGGIVGGLTSTLRIIPKVAQGFGAMVRLGGEMRSAFTAAEGGFSGLAAAGGTGAKAFAGLATTAIALGAAFTVLFLIIGPLVSLLSGLAAAATALAGSLTFAAAAAGGALLGALMPLAAGAGVVAAAFIGMDRAQRRLLSHSFAPLTREFSGLGDVARRVLITDIQRSATGLAPVIRGLRPLVRGVAEAMGDVFVRFSRGLQGSKFEAFKRDMQGFLPNAVRSLGSTFGHVFGGLGGLFRALIPLTNRFLRWINRITGEFSNWINTPAGQAKMIGFFQKAGNAAKSVGGFLREAARALGTLLGMGANSGNNIFDSMARGLRNFTSYLNANPGAVQRWFAHGEEVARAVGDAIVGIAHAMRTLDSASNREVLRGVFRGVGALAVVAAAGVMLITTNMRLFAGALGPVSFGIGKTIQGLGFLSRNSGVQKLGKDIADAGTSMTEFAIHGGKVATAARQASGGFRDFRASTQGLADSLDQVTGAATSTTRELIRQKLITTGVFAATRSYGISMRDLIGAATGSAASLRAVNHALAGGDPASAALREKLQGLGVEFNRAGRIVRQRAADLTTWGEALRGIKDRKVRIAIRETGMNPTIAKFRKLIKTEHLSPRQIRIAAKALNVDLTQKQLRALIKDAKNLDKQKPKPKPSVNTGPASASWRKLTREANAFDRLRPKPMVQVDGGRAARELDRVTSKVHTVDRLRANPSVNVRADLGAVGATQRALNSLRDKTVNIYTNYHTRGARGAGTGGQGHTASGGIIAGGLGHKLAVGGILGSLTNFSNGWQAGEAGREAVVPLNRPLAMVDPSVRWLSALAQGMVGVANAGKTVNVGGLTVITPTKDPMAVATEAVNQLVAKGY